MVLINEYYEKNFGKNYPGSIKNSVKFWEDQSDMIFWNKKFTSVLTGDLKKGNIKWFEGGKLNACYNCVDRHLDEHGDKLAIIWEGEAGEENRKITFSKLHKDICKFANLLKSRGIKKGDRVCIYLPMIPEAVVSMLACARIGVVHSVIFGGFSPESIKTRVLDADCCAVITADASIRNGNMVNFKDNIDKALVDCPNIKTVISIKNHGNNFLSFPHRDVDYHENIADMSDNCPCEEMDANDTLFILYTSGSTGKPKGVVHSVAGYLLYASFTHKFVFGINHDDIYWCAADIGWITGHSYIVYGPLSNATSIIMFEGNPAYPKASRCYDIIDRYKVNVFYTSPTFIRCLMKEGGKNLETKSLDSLRVLGSVGEPLNPECWKWYFNKIGKKKCPIMDTWWQTETGGVMISPPRDIFLQKPGMSQRAMLGVSVEILDCDGQEIKGEGDGVLVISKPWPGMMQGIYKNHKRFVDVYLKKYPGYYFCGDGAKRDHDGDYSITGRVDDMLKVSGHLLSTAEIESAITLHPKVIESAIVGYEHDIKGNAIYAFATLSDIDTNKKNHILIKSELISLVRKEVGPIASLDFIQFSDNLPKTRSGKIMRRILKKIANKDFENLGDTSTLSNPESIDSLIHGVFK
tara:strand:+ start:81 stop:1985 length:1905 start_codon:yes stop_codon:yes gene_type:complete